jgi:hypothetical protein
MTIVALCDNNRSLHGKEICGIKVINPININSVQYDYIVITSFYYETIKEQLIELKINEKVILNFNEIYQKLAVGNSKCLKLLKPAPLSDKLQSGFKAIRGFDTKATISKCSKFY